ncbi:hypothetical protein XFPR_13065 [Xylella fastidiosa]|uniref:hypothetical protein n=1 Tax=Xylella fastidiosa TaxID=2371 RepID=UPI0013144B56|nr:hypothetical protein [Xylella fastidiosa]MDG5826439.1 hypothetical protein [Xylella fastidiosa subsp. pauca]QPB72952.1 hypothetical protein XFPR_13065 [Xylella fastidiosa]WGZ32056.1 hypothetical protein O4444_11400 [Xylella fastidiosa subsp. pauca]
MADFRQAAPAAPHCDAAQGGAPEMPQPMVITVGCTPMKAGGPSNNAASAAIKNANQYGPSQDNNEKRQRRHPWL